MKIAILVASLFVSTQVSAVEFPAIPQQPTVSQQSTPGFAFVRGHKQGKGYSIQWSLTSNTGVANYEVQSTYEDPTDPYANWFTVGTVTNSNRPIHSYADMSVLPGIINYRIVANLSNNGGQVVSDIYTCVIQ
jgi:hypothetical protein